MRRGVARGERQGHVDGCGWLAGAYHSVLNIGSIRWKESSEMKKIHPRLDVRLKRLWLRFLRMMFFNVIVGSEVKINNAWDESMLW